MVGADVGALGEDAAAEPREDGDQRSPEAQRHQGVDDLAAVERQPHRPGQHREIARDPEQRQARHQHAGYGAGPEREAEAARERLGRGLGGAEIGADRHVHADKAGQARQHGPDQEPDRHQPGQEQAEPHEDHDADDGDGQVLAAEIGLRALGDRARDLLHPQAADVGGQHLPDRHHAVGHGEQPGQNDKPKRIHEVSAFFPG